MKQILIVCLCLCFTSFATAQEKSCDSILEEEIAKLDPLKIEVDLLRRITTSRRDFAKKLIQIFYDLFDKVDGYKSRVVSGSEPHAILHAALVSFKRDFEGIYCNGNFSPLTGLGGTLKTQEGNFSFQVKERVRSGCDIDDYYQMFAYAEESSFVKIAIGRAHLSLSESLEINFAGFRYSLFNLYSELKREQFVYQQVEAVLARVLERAFTRTTETIKVPLAQHFCPTELRDYQMGTISAHSRILVIFGEPFRRVVTDLLKNSPKRWDTGVPTSSIP